VQSHLLTSPPTDKNSYPKLRNPNTAFENFKKIFLNQKKAPFPFV
jgi:hypothetical protein